MERDGEEANRILSVEAIGIVKPAGISTASISENRRNYVAQAGFVGTMRPVAARIKRIETKCAPDTPARAHPGGDGSYFVPGRDGRLD